jgi:hypothetical protein
VALEPPCVEVQEFRREQEAFRCGQFLKAVVAREINRGVDYLTGGRCKALGCDVIYACVEQIPSAKLTSLHPKREL